MNVKDLVPRRRRESLARRRDVGDPFEQLHREFDRMLENFFGETDWPMPARAGRGGWMSTWPRVNVAESEKDIVVSAELPGIEEKDLSVELEDDLLTLRGEVSDEQDERGREWRRVERCSGSFERTLQLPAAVIPDKAEAKFKKGVLKITLPKAEPSKADNRRKIEVKAE